MNRNTLIAVLLLALATGQAAVAQDTNSVAAPARISLQTLMQKNIFDPTRSGRVRPGGRPRAAVVRTFTFRGSDGYVAFFTGEGTPRKGYVKVGDLINGFKVRQITLDFVKLTEPNGNIVELKEDNTMRRRKTGRGPSRTNRRPRPLPPRKQRQMNPPHPPVRRPPARVMFWQDSELRHKQEE